jgi:hypothetical protein
LIPASPEDHHSTLSCRFSRQAILLPSQFHFDQPHVADCFTVKVFPAIVTVPVLDAPVVLKDTE